MIDSHLLQQLADDALRYAAAQGASDCVLHIDASHGLELQVRCQSVESVQSHDQQSGTVTVYKGKRKGSSSVNQFDLKTIKEAIDRASAQAEWTEEDPYAGVAEDALLATERRDLDLYHPSEVDQHQVVAMALAAEQAAFDSDSRIVNSEGASFQSEQAIGCLATSRGFNQVEQETDYSLSCVMMARDDASQQVDYWYNRSRLFEQLGNPEEMGKKAAERALAKLGSRPVQTGKYPVLFVADMAKGFWSGLLSAISGGAVYRKSTFLLEHLNSRIFPQWLTVEEQPHIVRGFGSSDYDAEGVATNSKKIIDQGALMTWLLGSYSARKLELKSTGNAGRRGNIVLSGKEKTFQELVSLLGTGLIVTDTMGHGLNMVTGDFSVGAQGLWVVNGEIQHPVEEVTIAANLLDMYSGLVALGSDIDTRGSILSGSVLLEQMTIGGANGSTG